MREDSPYHPVLFRVDHYSHSVTAKGFNTIWDWSHRVQPRVYNFGRKFPRFSVGSEKIYVSEIVILYELYYFGFFKINLFNFDIEFLKFRKFSVFAVSKTVNPGAASPDLGRPWHMHTTQLHMQAASEWPRGMICHQKNFKSPIKFTVGQLFPNKICELFLKKLLKNLNLLLSIIIFLTWNTQDSRNWFFGYALRKWDDKLGKFWICVTERFSFKDVRLTNYRQKLKFRFVRGRILPSH